MELPRNHHSQFSPEWWDERRRRDYFIDKNGLVKIRPGSPTHADLRNTLLERASEIEEEMVRRDPKNAALYRARGVMYRAMHQKFEAE